MTVGALLRQAGCSLQANQKTKEDGHHPDRNAQFEFNYKEVALHQKDGQPVISVDIKKKELVGNFKNAGQEWRAMGKPRRVQVHDFLIPRKGRVIPYGIYDLTRDEGWVNLRIDHDTGTVAVESVRRWLKLA